MVNIAKVSTLLVYLLVFKTNGQGSAHKAIINQTSIAKKYADSAKLNDISNLKMRAARDSKSGKLDLAEQEWLEVLKKMGGNADRKDANNIYDELAELSKQKVDLHKELFYRLSIIKNMESSGDMAKAAYYYAKLALVYSDLGMFKQSEQGILRAIQLIKMERQYGDLYGDLSLLVYDLISQNRPQKAIEYLKKTTAEIPPENLAQKVDINEEFANCYTALKQYRNAENYYLEMMKLFRITSFNKTFYSSREQMITDYTYYNQILAKFYILTKQYRKANEYLIHIEQLPKGSVRAISLNKCFMMKFKVDSAMGNYISAIRQFEMHKKLNDSLFNLSKSQQIAELEIKYETDKKEGYIKVLQSQAEKEQIALQKANLQKDLTLLGIFMLVIISGLAYYGYRLKNTSNLLLQKKEIKINEQNKTLVNLLSEKDKLLEDKEILVKEIHHRVKNNLHMISSLLESQSAYLDNEALAAVQNSQHRIQAISLIHQKLYINENVTEVLMSVYIREIVTYLKDSFISGKRIVFEFDLDPIKLDVGQAVPIGLIINEAITNSIKHAFGKDETGLIRIAMKRDDLNNITLSVSDSGVGIGKNIAKGVDINNSLGINLINGLCKSIHGKITIDSDVGTAIKLVFLERIVGSSDSILTSAGPAGLCA
jgi:two-component sensor histidine kinase